MAVVVITGCRSGFGYEGALAFGRRGDTVHATLRDPSSGDRLVAAAAAEGLDVRISALDVTDDASVTAAIERVVAEHGRIDVVVNNAGVSGPQLPLEEQPEAAMRAAVETNVWGPIRVCRAVLPVMRAQGSGVIVNVSSVAARRAGSATTAIYGLTKAALSRLTESLHAEIVGFGLRAVALEPGSFATELFERDALVVDPSSPYAAVMAERVRRMAAFGGEAAHPSIVAAAMLRAVDDPTTPVRVLVGDDAVSAVRKQMQAELDALS